MHTSWMIFVFFFFKQKTAYEMRISDWSSDVCSSDLGIDTVYGSSSAYYHLGEDRIYMPHFATFRSAHGFYGTHIHECAHASGAAHRLDRDFSARWTKDALAMEEATAELTASFLLADLGIAHDPRPDHAASIAPCLDRKSTRQNSRPQCAH